MVDPIIATPEALDLLRLLKRKHGPHLLFMQSNACCDHSPIYCYKEGEYLVSPHDVLVGAVDGVPYYVDTAQHVLFQNTQVVISVVKGDRSGDLSLEGTEGVIFRLTSRPLSDSECAELTKPARA